MKEKKTLNYLLMGINQGCWQSTVQYEKEILFN